MPEKEFKLSNGKTIKIKSVSPFMLSRLTPAVMKEMDVESPPMYEVETVGGGKQKFSHNETTLEVEGDPDTTQENYQIWNEYQTKLRLARLEINRRFLRLLIRRGVEVDMPEDDAWLADHKAMGIDIPKDPMDLKIMYIQDVLVTTTSDWGRLVNEVMALSDITEEDVASATESFPDQMERTESIESD